MAPDSAVDMDSPGRSSVSDDEDETIANVVSSAHNGRLLSAETLLGWIGVEHKGDASPPISRAVLTVRNNYEAEKILKDAIRKNSVPDLSDMRSSVAEDLEVELPGASKDLEVVLRMCQVLHRSRLPIHTLRVPNVAHTFAWDHLSELSRLLSTHTEMTGSDRRPWPWVDISFEDSPWSEHLNVAFFDKLIQDDPDTTFVIRLPRPSEASDPANSGYDSDMKFPGDKGELNTVSGIIWHVRPELEGIADPRNDSADEQDPSNGAFAVPDWQAQPWLRTARL